MNNLKLNRNETNANDISFITFDGVKMNKRKITQNEDDSNHAQKQKSQSNKKIYNTNPKMNVNEINTERKQLTTTV